jgi:uncharacterized membrane protein YesL
VSRRGNMPVLQAVLADAFRASIALIQANIIWFLLTIPVVTAFPALGGLYYATNQIAHGRSADWRTFLTGFRAHFWLSWRWGLVNVLVLGVIGISLWLYTHVGVSWLGWVHSVALGLLLLWGILQLYTFPLLLEQTDRRMPVALRNSGAILLRRPIFTLGVALGFALVAVPSVYIFPPAWIFISASLCTYLANRAVIDSIGRMARAESDPGS